jgi:tetratricopeptide (TPR) repeat protein
MVNAFFPRELAKRAAVTASASASSAIVDSHARQHLALGQEHYAAGRIFEAIAAFQSGLEAAATDPAGCDVILADLHTKIGNCYMLAGQLDAAAASYRAALQLAPHLSTCWCNLANIQLQTGRHQEAIAFYLQALKLNPTHWASRANLAQALMAAKQFLVAKAVLQELSAERPQDGQLQHQLGKVCFELEEINQAITHFERAVALNPADAESLYWIGGIKQKEGDVAAAQFAYARAAKIQPLIRRKAIKSPPDFRVLALYAPFAGNTPAEFLLKDVPFDTDTLALFDASEVDMASLGDAHVVVNLISDADQDQSAAMLPLAARVAKKLGRPLINDPDKIRHTTRDEVASLLPGIAGCLIPKILRLDAGADVSAAVLERLLPFSFPVLARPAGTHGGDDFEKIGDLDSLAKFLAERPESDHYVIEYIDYASSDAHFRKYRFIFVGEKIMPYHLCIGTDWKLHHVTTDMANQRWMQEEEAAFLKNPEAVFSPANYAALREIRSRIGLDYFGIDCGRDARGNVVVFEVNASMLVHADNAEFPYKDPFVHAIKAAFEDLLRERAGVAPAMASPPLSP